MADRELTSNVEVDGVWYGPSYPDNKPTGEVLGKITNDAAFAPPGGGVDLRYTAGDFGVEEGEQPSLRTELRLTADSPSVRDVADGAPAADTDGDTPAKANKAAKSSS